MLNENVSVLIVDDDVDLCQAIAEVFEKFKFPVHTANNAMDALQIVKNQDISIVLSDIKMPGGDGFFLLDEIKKRNSLFPKVLFISGNPVDISLAYHKGIEGFFEKPFDVEEVKKCISRCLLRKQDLWRTPLKRTTHRISFLYYDWDEYKSKNEVEFGTGGIFIAQQGVFPKINESTSFKIEFLSRNPIRQIEGQGIVRWIRKNSDSSLPPGVGIEILHLHKDSMKFVLNLIEANPTESFIPIATRNDPN